MKLYLVKPDLTYFNKYNEMMTEWIESNTRIAPWFLDRPIDNINEFEAYVRMLDDCEHGRTDKRFSSTTSYFVVDENNNLIGGASLRHYLTVEGLNTFGHIGYGIRPSQRNKGYATAVLKLMLNEAKNKKIFNVLLGTDVKNAASCRVIEKCGGVLENCVLNPADSTEMINRYWISNI